MSIAFIDDNIQDYPEGIHRWHEQLERDDNTDEDINWDVFHDRAHRRSQNFIKSRQHAMEESDDRLFINSKYLPSEDDKPIWHVKCWVSYLVIISPKVSHLLYSSLDQKKKQFTHSFS